MNTIHQLHHEEHMEAMRRDFAKLWATELLTKLDTKDPRRIAEAQHKAWTEFKAEATARALEVVACAATSDAERKP